MATISFDTDGKINPEWGVKNLEKAIDEGSELMRKARTPEARAEFKEKTNLTPDKIAKLKQAYDVK